MKPLPSAIVDLITVIVLYAYLALYIVGFFAPTPDFVASHGPTMWCAFAAVVCFLYAFVQAGQRSPLRTLLLFVRVLFCLGVALSMDPLRVKSGGTDPMTESGRSVPTSFGFCSRFRRSCVCCRLRRSGFARPSNPYVRCQVWRASVVGGLVSS